MAGSIYRYLNFSKKRKNNKNRFILNGHQLDQTEIQTIGLQGCLVLEYLAPLSIISVDQAWIIFYV